jgi:hypothetical protein
MTTGRLIWQFAPAILVFVGAVLVALGGFWSSWRQSTFNATLTEKNNEISQLQMESANAITGGNSFAYMALQVPDPKTANTAIPLFIHQGKYPLYDVQAKIVDLDEHRRLVEQKDFANASKALMGTTLTVGNLTPGFASSMSVVLPHPSGQDFSYNVFYVARNGAWTQSLRMRWVGNGWAIANKVVGGSENKELYREVSANYPLNGKGEVDWEASKPNSTNPQGDSAVRRD